MPATISLATRPSSAVGRVFKSHLGVVDVSAYPEGDSPFGCRQMIGNIWEWTDSYLEPYPGFTPDPYREYSQPYFGQKPVLRGGGFASRSKMVRNTWRNFFMRHRRNIVAVKVDPMCDGTDDELEWGVDNIPHGVRELHGRILQVGPETRLRALRSCPGQPDDRHRQ